MRQRLFPILIALLAWLPARQLSGQQPFVCRGNSYIAITDGLALTKVYEIAIDPETEQVSFLSLDADNSGVDLNAIGYRYTDNFIYGVNTGTFELYRVSRDGVAQRLADLDAGRYLQFVAGDVSPEGRYLVLVGTSLFHDESLAFIDLDDPDYSFRTIPLTGPEVRSADVAFDPIDGTLYGFDGIEHRLITYDITNGEVRTEYPPTDQALLMGGLFFDTFGNLFGYGLRPGENGQRAFYRIDKETGTVTLETTGPPASRNDGCSCPYNVGLLATVEANDPIPCAEIPIRLEVWNNTREVQEDLRLELTFPETFTILAIDSPLQGELTAGGPGTNAFTLEPLTVPEGRHNIIVTVTLGPEARGQYAFQASLSGLPAQLGEVVLSDNPSTLVPSDSTIMDVGALQVDFSQVRRRICGRDTILLDPGVPGATYLWNDGSTDPTYEVTEPGTYSVTVSSGCETVEETITVGGIGFEVDLGDDRQITQGESTTLNAIVIPPTAGLTFSWNSSGEPVDCSHCLENTVSPLEDTRYSLAATDTAGCAIADSVWVQVAKNRQVFIPDAFSPNGDGVNDVFFPQSARVETVLEFSVFDRWGNLLFQRANFSTNDPALGWDGRTRGRDLNNGVYHYTASIRFPDGEVVPFQGQVKLLR